MEQKCAVLAPPAGYSRSVTKPKSTTAPFSVLVTGTAGGLIHILLFLAVVSVLLRVISGRKPVL